MGDVLCGWCNERPAVCFLSEETKARAREQKERLGYDFDTKKNGQPHDPPWPLYGCDQCCGHCRCGWAMCACEFIKEAEPDAVGDPRE